MTNVFVWTFTWFLFNLMVNIFQVSKLLNLPLAETIRQYDVAIVRRPRSFILAVVVAAAAYAGCWCMPDPWNWVAAAAGFSLSCVSTGLFDLKAEEMRSGGNRR